MPKNNHEKIMLAEHVLEVRYLASGIFLDVRGYIADYIRDAKMLPHWKIDSNVVNFRDQADGLKTEGAFIGYKSAGYLVLNSQTRNFFTDRATAFWKLLMKNNHYQIPELTRFGMRTKIFMPTKLNFDEINKKTFETFFTENARNLIGGKETDVHFTIELKEKGFEVRVSGAPLHKKEAVNHFGFRSDEFERCGLFLDIDYFKNKGISHADIPKFLKSSVDLLWAKAERIATGLGL